MMVRGNSAELIRFTSFLVPGGVGSFSVTGNAFRVEFGAPEFVGSSDVLLSWF